MDRSIYGDMIFAKLLYDEGNRKRMNIYYIEIF